MRTKWQRGVAALAVTVTVVACGEIAGLRDPVSRDGLGPDPSGDGSATTPEGIEIAPTSLALVELLCGDARGTAKTISLTNTGDAEVPFEARLPDGAVFYLKTDNAAPPPASDPAAAGPVIVSGTIKPHDQQYIYVGARSQTPQKHQADVVLKAGKSVLRVPVEVEIKGARLEATPQTVDFGEVRQETSAPAIAVRLKNGGNEPVTLTGWAGTTPEFILPSGSITIEPGEEKSVAVELKSGTASEALAATVTAQTDKPTCGSPPALALKGKRVNEEVLVNPATADFDRVDCGDTPNDAREFTISNYAMKSVAVQVKLAPDSWFTAEAPAEVLAASAPDMPRTAKILVRAKTVGATLGAHVENLEALLGPPANVTKVLPIKLTANGAILEVTPGTLDNFGVDEQKSFAIRNVGNAPTYLDYAITGDGFSVTDSDHADYLLANGNEDISVRFVATGSGSYEASLKIERRRHPFLILESAPVCVPLPNLVLRATR